MTVRMATADDLEKLIALRFDYFTAENWETSPRLKAAMEAQLRGYYAQHLGTDFFAALIEVEGDIAAAAYLALLERPANPGIPTGKAGTIMNVLTYPPYRKRGYATRAVNTLIDIGKRHSLSYIELTASEMGKPLYSKLGFHEKNLSGPGQTYMRLPLSDI